MENGKYYKFKYNDVYCIGKVVYRFDTFSLNIAAINIAANKFARITLNINKIKDIEEASVSDIAWLTACIEAGYILVPNPTTKATNFVLPQRWYIRYTEENRATLDAWKETTNYPDILTPWNTLDQDGSGYIGIPKDTHELSFEKFQKYVLKYSSTYPIFEVNKWYYIKPSNAACKFISIKKIIFITLERLFVLIVKHTHLIMVATLL